MDLFIYSDESGVFDKVHNEIFVYGGLIFIGKQQRDEYVRRYLAAEKAIRGKKYADGSELKACRITNKEKGKLYKSFFEFLKTIIDRSRFFAYPVIYTTHRLIKRRHLELVGIRNSILENLKVKCRERGEYFSEERRCP